MVIDITRLNNGMIAELDIDQDIIVSNEYFEKSNIKELKEVRLVGSIYKNSADIIVIKAVLSGIMVLEDSINLEEVDYPFSLELDEDLEENEKNIENTLDITDILWQNIMLEVPLKFTRVENFNEYQGDGWKLVSEDSIKNTNNPFNELKDLMGEE